MMFMKKFILFASIFAVICADQQMSSNGYSAPPQNTIPSHNVYSQPIQDNIAAESEVAKRGALATSTSSGTSAESQVQSSEANGNSNGSGTSGVISYSTPNSYQQFYSPSFGQLGPFYSAAAIPMTSQSSTTPQVFYVRAPQAYVTPSGVGTIKLTYTGNQAQPQTSITYASTAPKIAYAMAPAQYPQLAYGPSAYATPSASTTAYTYAPSFAIATPYTTNPYTNAANAYTNGTPFGNPLTAASLQQGQIIPYTANSFFLSPSQLQQLNFALPAVSPTSGIQPAAYTTASPIVSPTVPKIGTTVVTPTAAAYYPASPASQSYQQSPAFLSYPNAGSSLNYATAQKLVAVPSYTQAYRAPIPFMTPTAATTPSAYTAAYVQPTGIAPVKYTLAQPQASYLGSPGTTYAQKLYAPSYATSPYATASPYAATQQQQQFQTLQSVNQVISAANSNGAIQYGSQNSYTQPSTGANRYGLSQLPPAAQKFFYASA